MTGAAVVLAGGRSQRMGTAKALVPLGGVVLLDRVVARIAPQVRDIALSTNTPLPSRLPQLADPIPGFLGPLAGVLAALEWAARLGHEAVTTLPCDTPFVPLDVVAQLAAARAEIAVARSAGRVHPVCAVWPTSIAPALRATLADANGDRSVFRFLERYQVAVVDFVATGGDPFLNMNCRADVERAERFLAA